MTRKRPALHSAFPRAGSRAGRRTRNSPGSPARRRPGRGRLSMPHRSGPAGTRAWQFRSGARCGCGDRSGPGAGVLGRRRPGCRPTRGSGRHGPRQDRSWVDLDCGRRRGTASGELGVGFEIAGQDAHCSTVAFGASSSCLRSGSIRLATTVGRLVVLGAMLPGRRLSLLPFSASRAAAPSWVSASSYSSSRCDSSASLVARSKLSSSSVTASVRGGRASFK